MTFAELKVRKGEPVVVAWRRLVKWVDTLKIAPADNIEIRFSKHGTIVRVRDSETFRHPFSVTASGESARVSSGTLNGEVPVMKDASGDKRRIDNRDKDGVREASKSQPVMKLDPSKSSKDGRIFICLKQPRPPKDEKEEVVPAEIVQTDSAKGPVDGFGYYPLAVILLAKDRKSIDEVFQVTHHNVRSSYQVKAPTGEQLKADPEAKPIGRHIFYPA